MEHEMEGDREIVEYGMRRGEILEENREGVNERSENILWGQIYSSVNLLFRG